VKEQADCNREMQGEAYATTYGRTHGLRSGSTT
jgi:hypothetical protein